MLNNTASKALLSIGTAAAASRIARSASSLESDDVLGWLGLMRRRSTFWENVALVGAGVVAGAAGALLLAPRSGRETRKRLGESMNRLGEEAVSKLEEAAEKVSAAKEQVVTGQKPQADSGEGNLAGAEHSN